MMMSTKRPHYTAAVVIACFSSLVAVSCAQRSCSTIQSAFSLEDSGTYFLSGTEFIEYSFWRGSEAKVGPIASLGLDDRVHESSAAFTLQDGRLVILKQCQYFIYGLTEADTFVLVEEGSNLGGLPCSPDAALTSEGNILVTEGCNVWTWDNTTQTFIQDGQLPDRGLPCDLDAAVQWWGTSTIYIKGSQYWELDDGDLTGPKHIDELHICSWYICGEADWMADPNRGRLACNGDQRFCGLRLDQATLPGLHNAGSGFNGGFGFLNCYVRNHARSILEQLQIGIRHLDIDTSWHRCSLLGSNHDIFCGGSVCKIIKQVRTFLRENPHEVVTLNFNHEMRDKDLVFPALNRQLKTQLGRMLNNRFRRRGETAWPTLRQAVRTNRRVFVFYTWDVLRDRYRRRFYSRNKWIHTESWLGSTWQEFSVSDNCSQIVAITADRCEVRKYRELVEVSIVPAPGSCVHTIAGLCRHYLHDSLRACQPHRHNRGKSPNVLLVDYPEDDADTVTSVFHAAFHQNVRNIYVHRSSACTVKIDAAVQRPGSQDEVLFFVGSKVIVYSKMFRAQINQIEIQNVTNIDSAHLNTESNIVLTKGCQMLHIDGAGLQPMGGWTSMTSCSSAQDAAMVWNSQTHVFKDCSVSVEGGWQEALSDLGLPCNLDAALAFSDAAFAFKGNTYWLRRQGEAVFTLGGDVLDWTIDAVQCS